MHRFLILCFIFLLFLCSCNCNRAKKPIPDNDDKVAFAEQKFYDNFIYSIDKRTDLIEVPSLIYSDTIGNQKKSFAFTDKDYNILKLVFEEILSEGKFIKTTFYFNGSEKIFSFKEFNVFKDNIEYFHQTKSYYDKNVIHTCKRFTTEDFRSTANNFKTTSLKNHKENQAMEIIRQIGDYKTNFKGFFEMVDRTYLIVGTKQYSSTLAFQKYNAILDSLKKNQKVYLDKELKIEFEIITEPNGFTFQALRSVSLVK